MIDWVHHRCKDWGDTRYYIDHGKSAPTSIWGRMKDGWHLESADPAYRPCPPEVMLGGALEVSVAIKKAIKARQLTEKQFQVLYLHYAERAPTKRKMTAAKISKRRYYDILNRAHRVLRRFMEPDTPLHSGVGDKSVLDEVAA